MALQQVVEQIVTGLGYDLVEIERSAGGLLRVTIDLPWVQPAADAPQPVIDQFVTVEDCEKVTRQLQFVLEVEGAAYSRLEVSSPGIDRPLFTPAQFARFVGEQAKVNQRQPVDGRRRLPARIVLRSRSDASLEGRVLRIEQVVQTGRKHGGLPEGGACAPRGVAAVTSAGTSGCASCPGRTDRPGRPGYRAVVGDLFSDALEQRLARQAHAQAALGRRHLPTQGGEIRTERV